MEPQSPFSDILRHTHCVPEWEHYITLNKLISESVLEERTLVPVVL